MFLKIQNKIHKITKEVNYTEVPLSKYFERQTYDIAIYVFYLRSSNLTEEDTRAEAEKIMKYMNQNTFLCVYKHYQH